MADLTELISRVRNSIEDSDGGYISDGEITDYLNEAYLDITARQGFLQTTLSTTMGAAGTSVANGTIDLPTDFIALHNLRLGTETRTRLVDDDEFYLNYDEDTVPTETLYRIFNDKIELYPRPASGTAVVLRYSKKPTALSAGADVPAIPETEHKRMVRYAQAHAYRKEEREGLSDRALAEYEEGLPALNSRARMLPGPFTLTMPPGPFDVVSAKHV